MKELSKEQKKIIKDIAKECLEFGHPVYDEDEVTEWFKDYDELKGYEDEAFDYYIGLLDTRNFNESRRGNKMKKRLNERKRLLNEGPGAGYDITLEGANFNIKNASINNGLIELELEVPEEYKRDFDAINAEGYDWDTQYGR